MMAQQEMAIAQDLPPQGGFPTTIRYQRYIPSRGPSGAFLFAAAFGIMTYGWYWTIQSNRERMELAREKHWARIHLVPILQAETDRDMVRRMDAVAEREAKMLSHIPDWSPMDLKKPVPGIGKNGYYDPNQAEPVYHTERHVTPTFVALPQEQQMPAQWWRGSRVFLKNPEYHKRPDFMRGENI